MISQHIIEELVTGLNEIFGEKLDSIILYGSVASADNIDESDVDIALVMKARTGDEQKKLFLHWNAQMDMKYDMIFFIIDIDKGAFDKWGDIVPFYKNIKNEGVVLWKAA